LQGFEVRTELAAAENDQIIIFSDAQLRPRALASSGRDHVLFRVDPAAYERQAQFTRDIVGTKERAIRLGTGKDVTVLGGRRLLGLLHPARESPIGPASLLQQQVLEIVADEKPGFARPRPGDGRTPRHIAQDDVRGRQGLFQAPRHQPPSEEGILPDSRLFEAPGKALPHAVHQAQVGLLDQIRLDDIDTVRGAEHARDAVVLMPACETVGGDLMAHPCQGPYDSARVDMPPCVARKNTKPAQHQDFFSDFIWHSHGY
jgi:hypothetical protein